MGDFLLDFRARGQRRNDAEALRFYPDMDVDRLEHERFTLLVSRVGQAHLWAPYEAPDGTVVALAGRIALDESQWCDAEQLPGRGGLACKAVFAVYRNAGAAALGSFSGAHVIHVYDPRTGAYHMVTDAGGGMPCYAAAGPVFGSHPDLLARASGTGTGSGGWDLTSMAQFVATGAVTFPYSYYRAVSALEHAAVHTVTIGADGAPRRTACRYGGHELESLSEEPEDLIAERIANAVAASSRRCTLPRFGRTAMALSGGLDSRTLLTTAEPHERLIAFCAFDEKNAEFRYAQAIADELGVKLYPFPRPFDHYGDHAEMGVRISGGMGDFVSNHFLGFRERLGELGVDNLVTGCYFDYLFKSLALDVAEGGLLRRERLRDFSYQSYLPHVAVGPAFAPAVRERLDALFPAAGRAAMTALDRARIALRRIFPLYHEGDNAQRLIPQRVMNWLAPSVDPAILELCATTPPQMKVNRRVFLKAVTRACGEAISRIPDSNTGLPLTASALMVGLHRYRIAVRRRLERHSRSMATGESWPNWVHYLRSSGRLRELWLRPNAEARALIGELCGEPFAEDAARLDGRPTQYFSRLLTLKIWLDQRCGAA